jgi:hypothetical protein
MDISVIIVNYRTEGLLKQCLRGIALAQPKDLTLETIVVDNASDDGSAAMVRANFPDVRLIVAETNRGYAAGVNLGTEVARGDVFFIMNPDLALFPGVLETSVQFLREHPGVGMVGPRLLNPDGTVQLSTRRFPSPMTPLLSRTPLGKLPPFVRLLRRYLMVDWDHRSARPVDWVLGAAMVVRASAADSIGPLDEQFFLYFEDVDWCRRFWQKGWSVVYLPTVELVHYHQRLSAGGPVVGMFQQATRVHIRSAFRYFWKYRGRPAPDSSREAIAPIRA